MSEELASCPFCDCPMRIESNNSWHRLMGNHDHGCVFHEDDAVMTVPATDEQRKLMVRDWNRRQGLSEPETTWEDHFLPKNFLDKD